MISTKNIVTSIMDVDENWIFETYLKLDQKLIGQELKIISVFNTEERTPSFTLFFDPNKRRYFYKCFSSSRGGTANELVQQLFPDLSKAEVFQKVISEYKNYLKGNPSEERAYKQFGKFKVDGFTLRNWNSADKAFWTPYGIRSKILEKYNIAPIQTFSMTKEENGESKTIHITRDRIYGYFTKTGALYKLYQPGTQAKFVKVLPYLQAMDQLDFNVPNLLIMSSMKDGLSFTTLDIPDWTFIAPDSENTMIPKKDIEFLKSKFKKIKVLFDEDTPGKNAAASYETNFGLEGIYTTFGVKDISDAVEKFKAEKVKQQLIKLL